MHAQERDLGIFAALIQRFEHFRLPRILHLKDKVDSGKTLSNSDIHYISGSLGRTRQILPLIDRHPEYQSFASRTLQLYIHIVSKGLENEEAR